MGQLARHSAYARALVAAVLLSCALLAALDGSSRGGVPQRRALGAYPSTPAAPAPAAASHGALPRLLLSPLLAAAAALRLFPMEPALMDWMDVWTTARPGPRGPPQLDAARFPARQLAAALDRAGRHPVVFVPPLGGVQMELSARDK